MTEGVGGGVGGVGGGGRGEMEGTGRTRDGRSEGPREGLLNGCRENVILLSITDVLQLLFLLFRLKTNLSHDTVQFSVFCILNILFRGSDGRTNNGHSLLSLPLSSSK